MAKTSAAQFIREVRQETSKVTWPTRRETAVSTGIVLLMVFIASIFFLIVDWLLSTLVRLFLGFGG